MSKNFKEQKKELRDFLLSHPFIIDFILERNLIKEFFAPLSIKTNFGVEEFSNYTVKDLEKDCLILKNVHKNGFKSNKTYKITKEDILDNVYIKHFIGLISLGIIGVQHSLSVKNFFLNLIKGLHSELVKENIEFEDKYFFYFSDNLLSETDKFLKTKIQLEMISKYLPCLTQVNYNLHKKSCEESAINNLYNFTQLILEDDIRKKFESKYRNKIKDYFKGEVDANN